MPLDAQIAELVAALDTTVRPYHELTPEEARSEYRAVVRARRGRNYVPEPVAAVRDTAAGPVPARIYTPFGTGPFPLVVFFHGGGWVVGDLDTHDNQARAFCARVGAVVVSVDYRLAPEHIYPAALDDCAAATAWAHAEARELDADPARLAVAGDSAGGNLAAAVCLRARSDGPPIAAQCLVYPATDLLMRSPSIATNGRGYLLEEPTMRWFVASYVPDETERSAPLASPLAAADLSGLPPAVVVTAEYDPLRDEGEAYARRLREAGVPVTVRRFDGLVHGFFGMGSRIAAANAAIDHTTAALAALLAGR